MSPALHSTITVALEVILFERLKPVAKWAKHDHSQWERYIQSLIHQSKEFWKSLSDSKALSSNELQVEFLVFQGISQFLRDRIPKIQNDAIRPMWETLDQEVLRLAHLNNLPSISTSHQTLQSFLEAVEPFLTVTENLIQAPSQWNFQWNPKENWEHKIGVMDQSLRRYKTECSDGVKYLQGFKEALTKIKPSWPWTPDGLIALIRMGIILRNQGVFLHITDASTTAALLHLPDKQILPLQGKLSQAQKTLADVQLKNIAYQQSIAKAVRLTEEGNFLQAETLLREIPPTFHEDEQKPIHDQIENFRHFLTLQEGLRQRVESGDLQKLRWSEIGDSCQQFRADILKNRWKGSEYSNLADRHLSRIEKAIRKNNTRTALKIIGSFLIIIALAVGVKFLFIPNLKETPHWYPMQVFIQDPGITYGIYDSGGKKVKDEAIKKGYYLAPASGVYYVYFQKGARAALARVQLREEERTVRVMAEKAFSEPYLRITLLDATQKYKLEPEECALLIDGIYMRLPMEGCHLEVGSHDFSLRQSGQPDHRIPKMVKLKEEALVLVSPWRAVTFNTNVLDLRVAINNGNLRRLPARLFLPVGNHSMIITDGRGDIRDSRYAVVPLEPELLLSMNVPSGKLQINFAQKNPGIQITVNQETFSLQELPWNLSGGAHQIKATFRGRTLFTEEVEIPVDETVVKTIAISRDANGLYDARFAD